MNQVPDVLKFLFEQQFNAQQQRWLRYASPKYKVFVTALSGSHGILKRVEHLGSTEIRQTLNVRIGW